MFSYLSWFRLHLLAGFFALGIRIGLWALPSSRIIAYTRALAASSPSSASDGGPELDAVIGAVRRVCRFVPRATCLTQALAALLLLHRYGHDAQLRLGVRAADGRLRAHAWLERERKIILGEAGAAGMILLPDLTSAARPLKFDRS